MNKNKKNAILVYFIKISKYFERLNIEERGKVTNE